MEYSSSMVRGSEAVAFWISWAGEYGKAGWFLDLGWGAYFILHPFVVCGHVVCAVGDEEDAWGYYA